MKKADLVKKVAETSGISAVSAVKSVEDTLSGIVSGLVEDGEVRIPGFGILQVYVRSARKGRNVRTGETIMIPASNHIRFKPSSSLKEMLN